MNKPEHILRGEEELREALHEAGVRNGRLVLEVERLKALLARGAAALDNGEMAILEEMREASKR